MKIDELETLLKEATPEPWLFKEALTEEYSKYGATYAVYSPTSEGFAGPIMDDTRYNSTSLCFNDAKLVTYLRNNAEKMLAVIRAAKIAVKDHDLRCEDSNSTLEALEDTLADLEAE